MCKYQTPGGIFCYIWSFVLSSRNHFRVKKVKWMFCYSKEAPFTYNLVYVNEVSFRIPLKMSGLLSRRTNLHWRVKTLSPTPWPSGRGEGLEVVISHQWPVSLSIMSGSLHKNPKEWVSESFHVGDPESIHVLGPKLHRRSFCLHGLALCIISPGCSFISFIINQLSSK